MLSRSEFEDQCRIEQRSAVNNHMLQVEGLRFTSLLARQRLVYQTRWLGEPALQLPQDLFQIQELICETRPDFVIEVGVAWAGSLLFYASVQSAIGHGRVIGIDRFIPKDLKERILGHREISSRILLVEGDSVSPKVLGTVKKLVGETRNVLVHLDSDHTSEHVSKELELYSRFVGLGSYLVCGDTHVELVEDDVYEGKPYSKGNNPMTSLTEFLATFEGSKFRSINHGGSKYLLTLNPGGILVRQAE